MGWSLTECKKVTSFICSVKCIIYTQVWMERCGNGRHCTQPGDVCDEAIGFCTQDRQLRGAYVLPQEPSKYSAGPVSKIPFAVIYDGDRVGTCGPGPVEPIPCGPAANKQCPWNRGRDLCCFVDPLDTQHGYCDVCDSPKGVDPGSLSSGKYHIFSPDTFKWSISH